MADQNRHYDNYIISIDEQSAKCISMDQNEIEKNMKKMQVEMARKSLNFRHITNTNTQLPVSGVLTECDNYEKVHCPLNNTSKINVGDMSNHDGTHDGSDGVIRSNVDMFNNDAELKKKRSTFSRSSEIHETIDNDTQDRETPREDCVFTESQAGSGSSKSNFRKRLVKQRSHSVPDMPDLLQNTGPPSATKSPDVVFGSLNQIEDVSSLSSNSNFRVKQEFEGAVYDGQSCDKKTSAYRRYKSVSFQSEHTVRCCEDIDWKNAYPGVKVPASPVSQQGVEGRQHYKHSSGYFTGGSSESNSSCLQSQLSEKSNMSDSVIMDDSTDHSELDDQINLPILSEFTPNERERTFESQSMLMNTLEKSKSSERNSSGSSVQTLKYCSEYTGNIPELSILQKTSSGGICVDPIFVPEMDNTEMCASSIPEKSDASTPPFEKYDKDILEECISKGSNKYSPSRQIHSKSADGDKTVHMPPIRETKEKDLRQDLISHEFTKILLSQPADCEDLLKKVQNLFPSDSSTPPPANSPSNKARLSPKKFEEFLQQLPEQLRGAHSQQEELLQQCSSIVVPPGFLSIPEESHDHASDHELESVVDQELILNIERSARCSSIDSLCSDEKCKKTVNAIKNFQENIECGGVLDDSHRKLLVALRCHSERCVDLKCPVQFCAILCNIETWDEYEAVCRIRSSLEMPMMELTDTSAKFVRFLKLSSAIRHNNPIKEGEDWYVLSSISESNNVVLAAEFSPRGSRSWAVKKSLLLEEDHQWDVYKQLRDLNHSHVVKHLWVMEQEDRFLVCTDFQHGGTLNHLLKNKNGLSWERAVFFLRQVIDGVVALHQLGIVFLNWTSCSILLDEGGRLAKVSNLTMSVNLTADFIDYGGVKNSLPPTILPPELLRQRPHLTLTSDTWGFGCLLKELTTGRRVWNQYRHDSRDDIWKKLRTKLKPPIPVSLFPWKSLFNSCWQTLPSDRKTLQQIKNML